MIMTAALASCTAVADTAVKDAKNFPADMFLNSEELVIADGSNQTFNTNVSNLSSEVQSVLQGISQKHPNFVSDLVEYGKKMSALRAKSDKGIADAKEARAIRDSFVKKYSKDFYTSIFDYGVQSSMKLLSGYLPNLSDVVGPMLKICFLINDVAPDDVSRESKVLMYYAFAMVSRRIYDLNYANQMLSSAEDFIIDGSDGSPERDFTLGIYMYRAVNNYFLGNYTTAISNFESAPEYDDVNSEWYLYNKLNLYLAYLALDAAKADFMLKSFLVQPADEKTKQAWAYRLLEALNSDRPSELIRHAGDGAKDEREKAERLCEAYYYIGMKYYHMGAVNTARLYFNLSMNQNVVEFLEHEFSAMALHYYFKN